MVYISPKRTICEVLRGVRSVPDITPEIYEELSIAIAMAKKMDAKLREYKIDWDLGFWQKNPKYTPEVQAKSILQDLEAQ